MQKQLLTDEELAGELGTGFKRRTIASLRRAGKIPYQRIGYRTLRYNLDAVLAALSRLEVKAVSGRRR
jgi:hypothetical protein